MNRKTAVERFADVLNFKKPGGILPMVEWAAWWDLTVKRWNQEGLPAENFFQMQKSFGLDPMVALYAHGIDQELVKPKQEDPQIYITDEKDYDAIRPYLFGDQIVQRYQEALLRHKEEHDKGDTIIRIWLDGFFWFPRELFGITEHLYAFYDYPDLMKRINQDLTDFNCRIIHAVFKILRPEFVGIGEDMSYNLGPMLSKETFDEFLAPYYKQLVPVIHQYGCKVLVDSDGDITKMIPWLLECGVDGAYPLERKAGVDLAALRKAYPKFIFLGGYDKMVMSKGEAAMRQEFERLLPVMKSGGYILSVDHQTPPEVSLENYKTYLRLLREYSEKAAQ